MARITSYVPHSGLGDDVLCISFENVCVCVCMWVGFIRKRPIYEQYQPTNGNSFSFWLKKNPDDLTTVYTLFNLSSYPFVWFFFVVLRFRGFAVSILMMIDRKRHHTCDLVSFHNFCCWLLSHLERISFFYVILQELLRPEIQTESKYKNK